ncbi:MAG: RNA polymerase sigma factor [Planctomycetota bacterium]
MPEPLLDRRPEPRLPGAYNRGVSPGQGYGTRRTRMDQGFRDADRTETEAGNLLPAPPSLPTEDEAADRRAEDHALIRSAQAGDESAFASLVERHRARAWRVARGLVGSDEDAQDLVQEAFLRVFRSLSTFDFDHGFTTWLYRIVTNLAIDHLRKRRAAISTAASTDEESDLDLPDETGPHPSAGLEHLELAREVEACLASLAPHFQSVLRLREMEGLPCTEIARIVGATHVTVRWRLHRGRKLFQEEWERRARFRSSPGGRSLSARPSAGEVPSTQANTESEES